MSTQQKIGEFEKHETAQTPFGAFEKGEEVQVTYNSNWNYADNPETLYGTLEKVASSGTVTIEGRHTKQRIHPDGTIYNHTKAPGGLPPSEMGEAIEITEV